MAACNLHQLCQVFFYIPPFISEEAEPHRVKEVVRGHTNSKWQSQTSRLALFLNPLHQGACHLAGKAEACTAARNTDQRQTRMRPERWRGLAGGARRRKLFILLVSRSPLLAQRSWHLSWALKANGEEHFRYGLKHFFRLKKELIVSQVWEQCFSYLFYSYYSFIFLVIWQQTRIVPWPAVIIIR